MITALIVFHKIKVLNAFGTKAISNAQISILILNLNIIMYNGGANMMNALIKLREISSVRRCLGPMKTYTQKPLFAS